MDELVDLVDFNDRVIGTVEKSRAHAEGLPHRTIHLWILHRRPCGEYALILQVRGRKKQLMPDRYDVSVGGHVLAGEEPTDAAIRECEEEMGFAPQREDLLFLGKRVELYEDRNAKNFEICYVYLMRDDRDLDAYPIRYPELAGICMLPLRELRDFLDGETSTAMVPGYFYDRHGRCVEETRDITLANFVPRIDNYLDKICTIADRYTTGAQGSFSI